jgi:hypothetical protein
LPCTAWLRDHGPFRVSVPLLTPHLQIFDIIYGFKSVTIQSPQHDNFRHVNLAKLIWVYSGASALGLVRGKAYTYIKFSRLRGSELPQSLDLSTMFLSTNHPYTLDTQACRIESMSRSRVRVTDLPLTLDPLTVTGTYVS